MKKFRYFILVVAGVAVMLGGCKDKEKYDESAFQDDLEPLSEDEVEAMDQNGDGEMAVADESDLEQQQDSEGAAGSGDTDGSASSDAADSQSEKKLDENGTYTDKDEVAQYIYEYGHVPSNLTAADYDNADSMLENNSDTYNDDTIKAENQDKLQGLISDIYSENMVTYCNVAAGKNVRSIKTKRTK